MHHDSMNKSNQVRTEKSLVRSKLQRQILLFRKLLQIQIVPKENNKNAYQVANKLQILTVARYSP